VYNLNYTPSIWGYKIKEKLHLGVREEKRFNTTGVGHGSSNGWWRPIPKGVANAVVYKRTFVKSVKI
jgi:hypothetical protein